MKTAIVLLAAASFLLGAERSADGVKESEKTWAAATVAADEARLRSVLADDLTYTHSNGETDTKAVYISNLKDGTRKYSKLEHEAMDVRLYGDTAVLSGTLQVAVASRGGSPNQMRMRILHVWTWKDGRWQMVAHQSLRLPN